MSKTRTHSVLDDIENTPPKKSVEEKLEDAKQAVLELEHRVSDLLIQASIDRGEIGNLRRELQMKQGENGTLKKEIEELKKDSMTAQKKIQDMEVFIGYAKDWMLKQEGRK